MECYTYLRNVTDLFSDVKTPYERRFGQPFKGPIIPFGSLVEYHLVTAKDQSRIRQFGKKVLLGLFLGYTLYVGGIWKGDVLVADFEELETMVTPTASPTPSQVMSQTTRSPTSSATPRVPSPTLHRHRT